MNESRDAQGALSEQNEAVADLHQWAVHCDGEESLPPEDIQTVSGKLYAASSHIERQDAEIERLRADKEVMDEQYDDRCNDVVRLQSEIERLRAVTDNIQKCDSAGAGVDHWCDQCRGWGYRLNARSVLALKELRRD